MLPQGRPFLAVLCALCSQLGAVELSSIRRSTDSVGDPGGLVGGVSDVGVSSGVLSTRGGAGWRLAGGGGDWTGAGEGL